MDPKLEIKITKDGSQTLFNTEFDEFYHSPRGAVSESRYVFIKNGLEFLSNSLNEIKYLK